MQFLINLAFKNLFRHKLRTIISVIAIAFSVMIVVFARGYMTGMADSVSSDNIQYNSGHIKIVTEEYHQQARLMPLDCPIDGFQGEGFSNMITEIENIDNVETVIPRLKFGAMSSSGDELITMMGWGIDKDKELQYTNVDNFITEGRMVENGNLEIVMGSVLLEKLNKKVGDKVTI
ncbi:ABC transporter permease, partial [candidate division WOR-3 bacterium]|nr:ABC transporter permease [candidate division WOR-3 bacterium]